MVAVRVFDEAVFRGVREAEILRIVASTVVGSSFLAVIAAWIVWDWRKGELALKGKILHNDGSITVDEEAGPRDG